jgi:ureidoacrylate peracid hydrolase
MADDRMHDTHSRMITIEATPEALTIDTAKTAVLVVDTQHDFGTKDAMFDRAGIDLSMIQRAVGPTANVLTAARKVGIPIVYLKMGFRPDLSDLGPADSPNRMRHLRFGVGETMRAPDETDSRILIRDTWNTDMLPELAPQANDIVMYKHRFSGFYETDLDRTLTRLGIRSLIVTGCTTSICVESTVRDAMFRDDTCVVLEDCTGEPIGHGLPRSHHDASLLVIQMLFGWVARSEACIKALTGLPIAAASEPQ